MGNYVDGHAVFVLVARYPAHPVVQGCTRWQCNSASALVRSTRQVQRPEVERLDCEGQTSAAPVPHSELARLLVVALGAIQEKQLLHREAPHPCELSGEELGVA